MNTPSSYQNDPQETSSESQEFDKDHFLRNIADLSFSDDTSLTDIIQKYAEIAGASHMPRTKNYPSTRSAVELAKQMGWDISLGEGSYIVPEGLRGSDALMRHGFVEHFSLFIGANCNIQEGVSFRKDKNLGFFQEGQTIKHVRIQAGNETSFAHGVTFIAKEEEGNNNAFSVDVEVGSGSFIGIHVCVGSNVKVGDHSAIWFGGNIGHDVQIGNDVLIGMGVTITDGTRLVDSDGNLLHDICIPPNAYIDSSFQIIDYSEYRGNPALYHSDSEYQTSITDTSGNSVARPNFILRKNRTPLADNDLDFQAIQSFNHHVVSDNERHAKIDECLGVLDTYAPKLKINQYIKYSADIASLREKGVPEDLCRLYADKESSFALKAYPKNVDTFLREEMPKLASMMMGDDDISEYVRTILDFPTIDGKSGQDISEEIVQKMSIGHNVIIGKVDVSDSCFANTTARKDEGKNEEEWRIQHCTLTHVIIHGGGKKDLTDTVAQNTVIHGAQKMQGCTLGSDKNLTTLNNTTLQNVKMPVGGVIGNNFSAKDVTFSGGAVITAPGSSPVSLRSGIVGNNVTLEGGNIETGDILANSYFPEVRSR